MKPRSILILMAVGLTGLAVFRHVRASARTAQLSVQEGETIRQRRRADDEVSGLLARIASDHTRLRALMAGPVALPQPKQPARSEPAAPTPADSSANARNAKIAGDPELREMAVKAYVNDQKLKFSGILTKLGLTPEQRKAFDAIQAEYEERTLDLAAQAQERHLAATDPDLAVQRQQLVQSQETEYQNLFGPAYAEWKQDNETLPEHLAMAQIAQLALSSAGAFAKNQVDQLAEIMAVNKRPGVQPSVAAGYDWDAIVDQATVILNQEQTEFFKTGVELLLAQSRMMAMTGKPVGQN